MSTPGAVRAAEKIWEDYHRGTKREITEKFAQIIDDETGLKELIEAAKDVGTGYVKWCEKTARDETDSLDNFVTPEILERVLHAISKAKGE